MTRGEKRVLDAVKLIKKTDLNHLFNTTNKEGS